LRQVQEVSEQFQADSNWFRLIQRVNIQLQAGPSSSRRFRQVQTGKGMFRRQWQVQTE
jgi:hypothetical protein